MPKTMVFEWPTSVQKKLENGINSEDCASWDDEDNRFFIVADGVSRDAYDRKGYSVARAAAERAVDAADDRLSTDAHEQALKEAFLLANQAVKELNKDTGLWGDGNNDYLDRDLAGTCLACMTREKNLFRYGYVGDCRVAHISSTGNLFITPDQVTEARAQFPKEGERDVRAVTIRKERRNNPESMYKTYGVLTGEDSALDPNYLKLGSFTAEPGDAVMVCSDGIAPFIEQDEEFRQLLLHGNEEAIRSHVDNPDSPYQNTDEKTLVLYRV